MASLISDLKVIVCEDEHLLALDLAQQLSALGATVVATVAAVAELEQSVETPAGVNAAILDIELADGEVYQVVPFLEERGIALAFYSAYSVAERPEQFSHIPWFDKLAPSGDIATALCAVLDGRSEDHIS